MDALQDRTVTLHEHIDKVLQFITHVVEQYILTDQWYG